MIFKTTCFRAPLALLLVGLMVLPACVTYRPGSQPASHWAVANSRQGAGTVSEKAAVGDAVVVSRRRVSAPMPAPSTSSTSSAQAALRGSGFLEDYARLKPSPRRASAHIWMKPDLDLRDYDALLFDEIQLVPVPGSGVEDLTPEFRQKAKDALRTIMLETIDPYYDVVDEAAEHVLRVRLAITDLEPNKGAALEAEFVDGLSGDVLLTFLDRIEGSTKGEVAEAEWRPAEGAFREWATGLLTFLDSWEKE